LRLSTPKSENRKLLFLAETAAFFDFVCEILNFVHKIRLDFFGAMGIISSRILVKNIYLNSFISILNI